MALEMFELLDKSLAEFAKQYPKYEKVEKIIDEVFLDYLSTYSDIFIDINSRIKSPLSLKEKMIRNEFYLNYQNEFEVLDNLHDLIGVNIQCRFISDEAKIMNILADIFEEQNNGTFRCCLNTNLFLALNTFQPQLQRNGYPIYRIDGYYMLDDFKINYELQIKSLIHNFWSDVEHQIVYKNNKLVLFDSFMSDILSSIRDNLEVVEGQLQTVSEQIKKQSVSRMDIGMTDTGFKNFLSSSINDIYITKIEESIGVSTDFRKCAGILSQYIYINHFLYAKNSRDKMIDYFELFDYLKYQKIDFSQEIKLEKKFIDDDIFISKLGQFLEINMNKDFKWHVFFIILFVLESGNNYTDYRNFLVTIRDLILRPGYLKEKFPSFSEEAIQGLYQKILNLVVSEMISCGKIEIVYEENIYKIYAACENFVSIIANEYQSITAINQNFDQEAITLSRNIREIFRRI